MVWAGGIVAFSLVSWNSTSALRVGSLSPRWQHPRGSLFHLVDLRYQGFGGGVVGGSAFCVKGGSTAGQVVRVRTCNFGV